MTFHDHLVWTSLGSSSLVVLWSHATERDGTESWRERFGGTGSERIT